VKKDIRKTTFPEGDQKTVVELSAILSQVQYQGWDFSVHEEQGSSEIYLQLHWMEFCADTGQPQPQSSRKWKLSPHMTKSEVVQTAFAAVLMAVEHEVRENFRFRDKAIFGPHFDVEELAAHMPRKDARKPPPLPKDAA
jgi:hypothetical protein